MSVVLFVIANGKKIVVNLHIDVVSVWTLLCFVLFSLLDIVNYIIIIIIIIIIKVISLQARFSPECG